MLLDRDKPLWPAAHSDGISRVSNAEMARINIEAPAALAEWIDLFRADRGGGLYAQLVDRGVSYLPVPTKTSKVKPGPSPPWRIASWLFGLVHSSDPERVARARADAERHPARVFANALVNTAWRNGPVENVHAGHVQGYPLAQRRVTPAEERALMRFASEGMTLGMMVCRQLAMEHPGRPWREQVLPYGLASVMLITPSGWTLTETSRDVRLQIPHGVRPAASGRSANETRVAPRRGGGRGAARGSPTAGSLAAWAS